MSNDPLVSVVVPCLNRASYLTPTIDSVLKQDYPNLECLVIDGGSRDGTLEILEGFGSRVRWVSEPDDGHADAINKGWKMSRGEILAWLNADDVYAATDAVRTAAAFLKSHPETDVVYGDHALISKDGKVVSDIIRHREWDLARAVKYCDHIITQPACFMKRSILEKVGWLDPSFRNCKDHELWLRIGRVGRITYLPVLLAYERQLPGLSRQTDVSESKVRLTEKFFRQSDLPAPFNSGRFRRRAMSNAHSMGSHYAWMGGHRRLFFESVRKAVAADPRNLPSVVGVAFTTIAASLLPEGFKRLLRRTFGLSKKT